MPPTRPALLALQIGADPERWRRVGFAVDEAGRFVAGDVVVQLTPDTAAGIRAWRLTTDVDGLPVLPEPDVPAFASGVNPNSVCGVDHVVLATETLDATTAALAAAGCQMRGERVATISGAQVVQRFFPLQNALVELVAGADTTSSQPVPDTTFWGVTFVCPDLISGLGEDVSEPRPAVQPGRQIATATKAAGLGARVAFMTSRTC